MDVLQQVAAVCFVVGLAVLAAALSRKGAAGGLPGFRRRGGAAGRIEVVQRVMLTPQHSVCILRVDGREVVVGLHPGGMTVMKPELGSDSK